MEHRRTGFFVALLLLSPLAAGFSFIPSLMNSTPVVRTVSAEATVTYTSASTSTEFGSTVGPRLALTPLNMPGRVVGFSAPPGKCSQYSMPVTVTNGTFLSLRMVSSSPVNIYLLPTYMFQTSANGCGLSASALLAELNVTVYTLHWVAPANGTFYIVLTGPTTIIMLTDQGSSKPVYELENMTYAVSTQTSFQDYTATSTLTYTTTSPTQPLYLQPRVDSGLAVVVVILCFGLAIFALKRRRGS